MCMLDHKEGFFMRKILMMMGLIVVCLLLAGCRAEAVDQPEATTAPEDGMPLVPEKLQKNEKGVPLLNVYVTDEETVSEMDLETYLLGVVAGEMKNDWPLEALKAQAILARTFVLKFCEEKESKYPGADVSTDIEEAQAFDDTAVNERVEQAVRETEGMVLSHNGRLPYAWFHAHSGGMTAKAREGLNWEKEEPGYTRVTAGLESEAAPEEARRWEAAFPEAEFLSAVKACGVKGVSAIESLQVGNRGVSGRAETILVNGKEVNAANLRIALGSTKMRSTLLSTLNFADGRVNMSGKGYGHGVGMPQWGAYGMAEDGKTAEEIVTYYFQDVDVEKLW